MKKKVFKMPRKQKKGFRKWMKGVRGIFPDPTNPNIKAQHILEDLFSLYKAKNCLGKPMFKVWTDKNGEHHSEVSEKGRKLDEVDDEQRESSRKLMKLINKNV